MAKNAKGRNARLNELNLPEVLFVSIVPIPVFDWRADAGDCRSLLSQKAELVRDAGFEPAGPLLNIRHL